MSLAKIIQSGNVEFVKWILDEYNDEIDVDILRYLINQDALEMFRVVVKRCSNINQRDHSGRSLLRHALTSWDERFFGCVLKHPMIDLSDVGKIIKWCCLTNERDCLAMLLACPRLDENVRNKFGTHLTLDAYMRSVLAE